MESDRTSTSRSDSVRESQPKARLLQGRTYGPSRRSTKGQWTPEEDEILQEAVQRFKGKNWKKIAQCFKDRTDVQCLHRWQKVLNPELVKGPWSKEEDDAIVELVKKYGPTKWSTIAQHLPGRIGKQCRERWHNHLNPNINKEAWTQEEELALIRAHQIYGNKWAELTKYLPGRSDNAIKNHWNSSVKKKLDSYMASGLLAQFQGLPNPIHTIQNVANCSKTPQSSEEDSFARNGQPETEEVSQCSQGSVAVGFSQSTSDAGNTTTNMDTGEVYLEYNLPVEWGGSMENDWQLNQNNLPKNPMSGQLIHSLSAQFHHLSTFSGHNGTHFPLHSSGNMALATEEESGCHFAPEEEGGKIIGPFPFQSGTMDGSAESLHYQSSTYQFPMDGTSSTLQPCFPSFCQSFPDPSQPMSDPGSLIYGIDPIFFNDSTGLSEQNALLERNDSFRDQEDNAGMAEELDHGLDTSRVTTVNGIGMESTAGDFAMASSEQKDSGALFYEPPRFPSFDIPFFSCDLSQPNSEMQQEYSPLGIRQLMISSSVNTSSPYRLWDYSPSRDDSPDAVLKSAAKTFSGTPSILKKRHRDMLSPLSEKRNGKRLESTSNIGSFSSLARDFSRLEGILNETGNENPSLPSQLPNENTDDAEDEDKENKAPGFVEGERDGKSGILNSDSGSLEKDTDSSAPLDNMKQLGGDVDNKFVSKSETALQPQPVNQPHCSSVVRSPGSFRGKEGSDLSTVSAMNLTSSFTPTVNQPPCLSVVCSPGSFRGKEGSNLSTVSASFTPTVKVEKLGNSTILENYGLFGGTPFRRSMDSPSAWKSPWFVNSFLPGQRVDTDICMEDLEFFMSPVDRSYDALGLMKQLSEQTASAFATAQEVLGNETPKTELKNIHNKEQKKDDKERITINASQPPVASNTAAPECRTLDFSECGTPGKVAENGPTPSSSSSSSSNKGIKFSTSTSYLLKGCR